VAVADMREGRVGSINLALEPLNTSERRLELSRLVLGRISESSGDTKVSTGGAPQPFSFVPTASRTFQSGETLGVFARTFWHSDSGSPVATLVIEGAGPARSYTIPLSESSRREKRVEALLNGSVRLDGLPAGDYVCTLTVSTADGQRVSRRVPITVR
jgi:hypothetical protein